MEQNPLDEIDPGVSTDDVRTLFGRTFSQWMTGVARLVHLCLVMVFISMLWANVQATRTMSYNLSVAIELYKINEAMPDG